MIRSKSLKTNLIFNLSLAVFFIVFITAIISFVAAKEDVEEVFDINLAKSSKIIFNLIKHEIFEEMDGNFIVDLEEVGQQKLFHRHEYKVQAMIWKDDALIFNSDNIYLIKKPTDYGFKDLVIDKKEWRSFALYDEAENLTILTLERKSMRDNLIYEIMLSLLLPILASLLPLLMVIIYLVDKKIEPLNKMAEKISKMSGRGLKKFSDLNTPKELEPLVTSFNSLVEKLEASMEAEKRFTDYAAHELKTPISAITIQAQLLLKTKNPDKQKEYLQDLISGVYRMKHMVNQLLVLVRLEPEDNKIKKENFPLCEVVKKMLEEVSCDNNFKKEAFKIECDLPKDDLIVNGNKTYIEIMIRNLMDNAIKYNINQNEIIIEISKKLEGLSFKIINNGEDIKKENQKKIFDNFFREKSDNRGCGVGLAIVKKIIDLHGGSIIFDSKDGKNSFEVII